MGVVRLGAGSYHLPALIAAKAALPDSGIRLVWPRFLASILGDPASGFSPTALLDLVPEKRSFWR